MENKNEPETDAEAEVLYSYDYAAPHFNVLTHIGLWVYDGENPAKKRLHLAYVCASFAFSFFIWLIHFAQLYVSGDDIAEVSFNLISNSLTGQMIIKILCMIHRRGEIEWLRKNLREDDTLGMDPGHLVIRRKYAKRFRIGRKLIKLLTGFLFLTWMTLSAGSVVKETREMPFSIWIPTNYNDNVSYLVTFTIHGLFGVYVIVGSVNTELAIFTLFGQVIQQYELLAYDFNQINNWYSSLTTREKENHVDKASVEDRVAVLFKKCTRRHMVLVHHVQQIESIFNRPLLLHVAFGSILVMMSGIILMGFSRLTLKGCCEAGYLIIIVLDLFLLCLAATLLMEEKNKVLNVVYDFPWYEVNCGLQKDIGFVIVGLQKNQELTACGLIKINLKTFMQVLNFVASWWTLFWKITHK